MARAFGTTLSAAALVALTLSACGSDNNAGTSTSSGASGTASASADCGGKNSLTAEGSTAQQNAIAEFNKVWGQVCSGKTLAYNPTGSGAGVDQFIAKQVDFAGSDSALKDDQVAKAADRCGGNPAWNLPLVFGPVAMAFNVEGVDNLVVNGDVLAKIFQGQIKKWNDPAIAALNSGATLPDADIKPIYRSDSSGTTDNFQKYLARRRAADAGPRARARSSRAAQVRVRRSRPVSYRPIQATPGAIGYVEKGFAQQAGLKMAQIDSGGGRRRAHRRVDPEGRRHRQVQGRRHGPDARPERAIREQGSRCLPADAGDLRDRLLQGL